jgi:hypothetical protein
MDQQDYYCAERHAIEEPSAHLQHVRPLAAEAGADQQEGRRELQPPARHFFD